MTAVLLLGLLLVSFRVHWLLKLFVSLFRNGSIQRASLSHGEFALSFLGTLLESPDLSGELSTSSHSNLQNETQSNKREGSKLPRCRKSRRLQKYPTMSCYIFLMKHQYFGTWDRKRNPLSLLGPNPPPHALMYCSQSKTLYIIARTRQAKDPKDDTNANM